MPVYKVLNKKGLHRNEDARTALYEYICSPNKTPSGYTGTVGIESDVVAEMERIAQEYHKNKGIKVRHFIVSYEKRETNDPMVVNAIAQEVAAYIGQKYQTVYAVHEDTDKIHFHVMFNAVSYVTGYKYHGKNEDHYEMINVIKAANRKFGIYGLQYVSTNSEEDIQ